MTQAKPNLCQLVLLAGIVACVAADIVPHGYRPVGPRGPPPHKLVKRPLRPLRPPPPHYRPQPVHLGRQPAPQRPHKFAPPQHQSQHHVPRPIKPTLQKHFSPSPVAQPTHFVPPVVNEGAIHTIPAPNLGPNAGRVHPPHALVSSVASPVIQPALNTFDTGYKVHEESSKASFGRPFFAPDPDPSRPAAQVPITKDPNSHPSSTASFDLYLQQQFEASAPQPSKVAPPPPKPQSQPVAVFQGDPNSRFLQAFQDQYHRFDPKKQQQQQSSASDSYEDKEKNDIDYDSGAEVRYSFAPAPAAHDQDDASSQYDDDDEILEDSGASFGDKLTPKRAKKN